jgi:hypothetical protein
MSTWDVFLSHPVVNYARQWVGIVDGDDQDQAMVQATPLYGKPGYDLAVRPTPKRKRPDFDPTAALARYRELEGLLNLELFQNPRWQAMRAQGDTSFLLTSRYFQEQERLVQEIDANGYSLFDSEDLEGESEHPIYEIEPLEE